MNISFSKRIDLCRVN